MGVVGLNYVDKSLEREVILLVVGSRVMARLGWFLARGWSPAGVFRLLWYRFGLFR